MQETLTHAGAFAAHMQAHIVMAYIVMAYILMACIVMAFAVHMQAHTH